MNRFEVSTSPQLDFPSSFPTLGWPFWRDFDADIQIEIMLGVVVDDEMVVVFNDDDFILKTHAPASSWRCWFRPTHGWTPIAPIHDVISMCAHHVISYHVRQKSHFLWPSFALRKTKTWLTTRHPSKGLVLGLFSQHGRKWAIPSGKGSSKKNW